DFHGALHWLLLGEYLDGSLGLLTVPAPPIKFGGKIGEDCDKVFQGCVKLRKATELLGISFPQPQCLSLDGKIPTIPRIGLHPILFVILRWNVAERKFIRLMPASTKTAKILIVDDEPLIRETLAEFLGHEGFAVSVCGLGKEALELAAAQPFEVALCDV